MTTEPLSTQLERLAERVMAFAAIDHPVHHVGFETRSQMQLKRLLYANLPQIIAALKAKEAQDGE